MNGEKKNIGQVIMHLSRQIDRKISGNVAQYGISNIQAKIIGFLYKESSVRNIFQKDIEERFDIRRSSVTSVLNLMETNGYIRRVTVEKDGRLKKIELLDKGLEIQSAVFQSINVVEKQLSEALTEDEKKIFFDLFDKLYKQVADW